MNNQEYWELRRAREMYQHMEEAEKLAKELDTAYRKAALYLQGEAEQIFNKYQDKYNLTRAEAELLLKNSEVPENIEELKQLLTKDKERYKDLLQELETPAYKARIDNLANVYGQLDSIVLPMIANERRKQIALYEKLAEEAYYQTIFDLQQYSGYGFDFKALDRKTIEKVLNTKWTAKSFSQSIWDNTNALAESVKREILVNLLTGRPLVKAQQAIQEEFESGSKAARRLVRTESAYVCNQLQIEGYKACGVERYIYVAILDLKTSQMCRNLDKKDFAVEDAKVGFNYPPMHPWCRSTTIAYISKEVLAKMKQSAIDPATGKRITVPGDMTYKEWYKQYVKGKDITSREGKQLSGGTTDQEQYKRYKATLRELAPATIEEFKEIKYNNTDKWKDLKAKYRILNQYKIDNGSLTASEILKMDGDIIREKRNNFTSDYKKSGNIAGVRVDEGDHYYIAHSSLDDPATPRYKGENTLVGLKADRRYKYIDVPGKDGKLRSDTYYDTEAKLFEYLADLYKESPFTRVDLLSERGMCNSCLGVMEQFMKEHPTVVVNAVSNKKVEGNVWKYRYKKKN